MIKFKKGDTVLVTSGKDKGRSAVIEKIMQDTKTVLLPGVNIYKKHIKQSLAADGKGGIYEISRPINVAKIAIMCPHCKKPTRVGFRIEGDGTKARICKKCGRSLKIDEASKSEKVAKKQK